jgi:hypothetical protein
MTPAAFRLGALALALLAAGCMRATFLRTDGRFQPSPRPSPPPIFIDRLPEESYRSVGIIEPRGADLSARVAAARAKGQELGCDLVLSERIHWTWQNQQRDGEDPVSPVETNRFICGQYVPET